MKMHFRNVPSFKGDIAYRLRAAGEILFILQLLSPDKVLSGGLITVPARPTSRSETDGYTPAALLAVLLYGERR